MAPPDRIVAVRSFRRGALAALVALLTACAASEEEIQKRFNDYVATANACERDDQCTLAEASCPLGCFVAVRADRKADVEARARELIAEYERGGRRCIYGCVQPGPIICREQRCLVLPAGYDAGTGPD
jgi:hypothetical protein